MKTIYVNNMGFITTDKYNRKTNLKLTYLTKKNQNQIRKYISNYNYLKTFLNFGEVQTIYKVNPLELLSPINYDIFIKYVYFKNTENHTAKKMYLKHIKIFNNYQEPDGSKNNKKDFLNGCTHLLNNYDSTSTIIPISKQGIIIDGAHRTALSIFKNTNILCTDFDTFDLYFDFTYFAKRGFPKKYQDYVGFVIIELVNDISCIVLKYNSKRDLRIIISKMKERFDVYYYRTKKNKIIFLFSNAREKTVFNSAIVTNKESIINEYSKFVSRKIRKKYEDNNL